MNKRRSKLFFLLFIMGEIILLFFLAKIFSRITPSYNIVAETEFLEFSTNKKLHAAYNLFNAKIYYENEVKYKKFNGVLKLQDSVKISFIRNTEHRLDINIESKNKNKKIVDLLNSEEEFLQSFKNQLSLRIEDTDSLTQQGISLVFPIRGAIEVGKSVDYLSVSEISPILRNGKIDIILKSIFGNKHYIANEQQLEMGDVFRVQNDNGIGFVNIINGSDYLNTSFRARGQKAFIIKPGPKLKNDKGEIGVRVSASFIDRFLKDEFFSVISILITTLVIGITIMTFYFEIIQPLKNPK